MHKDQNAATRAGRTRRAAPVRACGAGEAGGACPGGACPGARGGACPGGACPGARGGGKRMAAGGCSNGRKRARLGERPARAALARACAVLEWREPATRPKRKDGT